ncbi:hypothetical protein ACS0TY_029386 [Phlomoides rotata]
MEPNHCLSDQTTVSALVQANTKAIPPLHYQGCIESYQESTSSILSSTLLHLEQISQSTSLTRRNRNDSQCFVLQLKNFSMNGMGRTRG